MNILIDRHHAGLFNSLQLLFEDRLGYTVYIPIGHEWWDEGYWQFGAVFGDDRLAQQYLKIGPEWTGAFVCDDAHGLLTFDPEFPRRQIHGVALGVARQMPWDAVLATVQENQQGFHRFAQEHGAKYLVGVGNTNQQIDWALDPLVLNSSEMPLLGKGVQIGQEFDSDGMFGYSGAGARLGYRNRIASFVNCMPEICADHDYIARVVDALRDADPLELYVYGISGPQGNIKPIGSTAQIMRDSGWALHDKPQGDGFGHVLHYWAAIGRPLIGHASHYNGKNGQVFWHDLQTCIDLDKHPIDEAIALIREISADPPRHEKMCRLIREIFDATTDWAGDAEKVRRLIA